MAKGPRIISIIGPESTGKTTLTDQLGTYFSAPVVPEFAREFLRKTNGVYSESDLVEIAIGQLRSEQLALEGNSDVIICDTDVLVIKVWQEFKFGHSNSQIDELLHAQQKRTYLLMYPDLKWQPDPLRENPHDLMEIFNFYVTTLDSLKANYFVVHGSEEDRSRNALNSLNSKT